MIYSEICVYDSLVSQPVRQLVHTESLAVLARVSAEGDVGVMGFHKHPQIFLRAACRHQNRPDRVHVI